MFGRIFGKTRDKLTKLEFTDVLAGLVNRGVPDAEVFVPRELEFIVRLPGRDPIRHDLTELWEQTESLPIEHQMAIACHHIDALVREAVSGQMGSQDANWTSDKIRSVLTDHFLPVIRSKHHSVAAIGLLKGMPHRVLAGNLVAYCVVDLPEHMFPLYSSEIETIGIGEDELWAQALENLRRRNFPLKYFNHGVGTVMHGDDYESSLLLDDQFWAKVERDFGGEHLAMIPCSNTLMLVRPDSDQLGEMIKHCAGIFLDHPAAISTDVFCRRNGAWQVWPVPEHLKPQLTVN